MARVGVFEECVDGNLDGNHLGESHQDCLGCSCAVDFGVVVTFCRWVFQQRSQTFPVLGGSDAGGVFGKTQPVQYGEGFGRVTRVKEGHDVFHANATGTHL